MRPHNSSSGAEDQFSADLSTFHVESVPNTGIKLLRARPETEPALGRQLSISHRLKLLRRSADPAAFGSTFGSTSSSHHSAHLSPPSPMQPLKDVPISGRSQTD